MSRERTITFMGKRVRVRWVTRLGSCREGHGGYVGDCSPPGEPNPTIRIKLGQSREDEREAIIHEFLHFADFTRGEDWVRSVAANLNKVLTTLGHPAET